jgi:GT2 family glycosyltransferase
MPNLLFGYGHTEDGNINLILKMHSPKVAIVILNWNGQKFLEQFLPSVFSSKYSNFEVIVGDNDSTDQSLNFLTTHFPLVKIIRNEKNFGFAEGYNKVLSQVDADYFVLLNSDVEVTPNWIQPVINLMESDESIAVAQPKVKSFFRKTHFEYAGAAGCFIDYLAYPFCRGRIFDTVEEDLGQYDDNREIFWAAGCALFIKSAVWKRVKGLDEMFFAHMEEIDLCWRIKNLGLKVMYCGASTIYHVGGGTLNAESPFKTYLNFRNNHYLIKKNMSPQKALFLIPIRFCLDLLALLKFIFEGKWQNAMAISKAHQHVVKALWDKKITNNKDISSKTNLAGMYQQSVVWKYFVIGKRKFNELD